MAFITAPFCVASAEFDIDVILLKKEEVYQVLQYKKK